MLKCASPDRFSKLVVPTLLLSIVPVFFLPEVFIPWVFETPAEMVPRDAGLFAPFRGFEGPSLEPRQFHQMFGMESLREDWPRPDLR